MKTEENIEVVMGSIEQKGKEPISIKDIFSSIPAWKYILPTSIITAIVSVAVTATAVIFIGAYTLNKSGATMPAPIYQSQPTAVQMVEVPPTAVSTLEAIVNSLPIPGVYQMISIEPISTIPARETNLGLIPGYHLLNGIPFDFGWHFESQSQERSELPLSFHIAPHIKDPSRVYFLIQAGWGYNTYAGKQIADISLHFSQGQDYVVPIIMGDNLRDWSVENPSAVTTVSSSTIKEAWSGDSPYGKGRIDMLTIDIPPQYKGLTLESIELVDTSVENAGSMDPTINILGITTETSEYLTPTP